MNKLKNLVALLNGFRKFSVMMTLVMVAIIFRVYEFISGSEFVDLLKNTAVAYMSFNGLEHMTKTVSEWIKNKAKKELQ